MLGASVSKSLLSCLRQLRSTAHPMSLTASRSFSSYLVTPREFSQAYTKSQAEDKEGHGMGGRIVPLCASWFLPNDSEKRTGIQVFEQGHIPEARFFDLDEIKDPASPYPHMLPSASAFGKAMAEMNVGNADTVVVYDTKELGIFSAPRVAWMLKVFGHEKVHILNNFRVYVEHGLPIERGPINPQPQSARERYRASEDGLKAAVNFNYMSDVVSAQAKQMLPHATILDARPKGRFDGTAEEPRPGLPSGHMPRSINMPFMDLLDPVTKTFLPPEQLKAILDSKGVDSEGPIISSCGTGVSAAIIDAALSEAGYPPEIRLLYDGSWTEWAQRVQPHEDLILKSH